MSCVSSQNNKGEEDMQKIYVSQHKDLIIQIEQPEFTNIMGKQIPVSNGKSIRFSNGQYITSDPKEIEALEKSMSFGSSFFDLLKQENEAKKAQEKVKSGLAQIVEGARASSTQIKPQGADDNKPEEKPMPAPPVAEPAKKKGGKPKKTKGKKAKK